MKYLLAICLFKAVLGWWSTGHMIVTQIAQIVLQAENPQVLNIANQILEPLYGPMTHGISNSFVESACWPDDIKVYGFHDFDSWHFTNKPYDYDGFLNITDSGEDVIWALNQCMSTLGLLNYQTAILENALAMRFLLHFVGDYHQPLHVTTLWSRQFPSGDQGGNLFNITFDKTVTELHALWDSVMGEWEVDLVRPLTSDGWHDINMWAEWCMGNYTQEDLAEELAVSNITDWVYPTYHLGVDYAYHGIKPLEKPSEEYLKKGWQIALRQLSLGGRRLAQLLINLFGQEETLS
ncbi:unnamed protein product [Blepharisma stoltei]|uniref:S1/P1 nuclease n=1 Tax=Blepharisma stoltei TaxID=1481888 RepID=A0AAU9IX27_9CILI|nr:unnamed protein product [Blepharisma stoltei]